ncbi:hypothetical protein TWF481_002678 [Arthrobotrys musiformis]|uniref:Uncharacterized protein n=1 Tax=Arthrobotrys musiformis TaxID=47236 RepID=A0AAV9VR15_9PEZI
MDERLITGPQSREDTIDNSLRPLIYGYTTAAWNDEFGWHCYESISTSNLPLHSSDPEKSRFFDEYLQDLKFATSHLGPQPVIATKPIARPTTIETSNQDITTNGAPLQPLDSEVSPSGEKYSIQEPLIKEERKDSNLGVRPEIVIALKFDPNQENTVSRAHSEASSQQVVDTGVQTASNHLRATTSRQSRHESTFQSKAILDFGKIYNEVQTAWDIFDRIDLNGTYYYVLRYGPRREREFVLPEQWVPEEIVEKFGKRHTGRNDWVFGRATAHQSYTNSKGTACENVFRVNYLGFETVRWKKELELPDDLVDQYLENVGESHVKGAGEKTPRGVRNIWKPVVLSSKFGNLNLFS